MSVILTEMATSGGLRQLCVRNEFLELTLLPEAGGKLLDLRDLRSGRNVLWRNPRVSPARTYPGAAFDDLWCGGWDEIFPSDIACDVNGSSIHDHGDAWTGPWDWSADLQDPDRVTLRMTRYSPSLPCQLERTVTVTAGAAEVAVGLQVTNLSDLSVDFLWSQHIALAVGKGSRLHLPAGRLAVEGPTVSRADTAKEVTWPSHGSIPDFSVLPGPSAGLADFWHTTDLRTGWLALTYPEEGVAVRVAFDVKVFPVVWLFASFGGWRGHHVLVAEPSSGPPGGLAKATKEGTAIQLDGHAHLATAVRLTLSHQFRSDVSGDCDPIVAADSSAEVVPEDPPEH